MGIKQQFIDMTGKVINRLTVIKFQEKRDGRAYWLCKCTCGKEKIMNGTSLRRKSPPISCGCFRMELQRKKPGESNFNRLIRIYKRNAKRRGLTFSLTNQEIREIFALNCFYCGTKPSNGNAPRKYYGDFLYNGIDRINNSLGYVLNNVVPCCKRCNYMKNNLTHEDFLIHIKKIYTYGTSIATREYELKNNGGSKLA